MIAANSG
ncbi:hypothetical protein YPPY36_1329, partial [Yersinia pestis PY-36]